MKVKLDYETYKNFCLCMAEKIREFKADEIIAVMRGGMSAAHIISKHLNLPCGAYFPGNLPGLYITKTTSRRLVFVEDLIAKGRTLKELTDFMQTNANQCSWSFAPVLIDSRVDLTMPNILTYGMVTPHWVVMPYEETENVVEGDWGLSRDGSDKYGKGN